MHTALSTRTGKVVVAALAVTITALLGVGGVQAWARSRPPDVPKQPTLTFTQDKIGVHVTLHNPNTHWALRDSYVEIWLIARGGAPITNYGPDHNQRYDFADPTKKFYCCHVTYLGPGGDYTFNLPPPIHPVAGRDVTEHVAGVNVTPARDRAGWTRVQG